MKYTYTALEQQIIDTFHDKKNDFLSKYPLEKLYEIPFIDKDSLRDHLENGKQIPVSDYIQWQHSIELILDPSSVERLIELEGYIKELFEDENFRTDENEDGEMDDKDVEQLDELRKFIDANLHGKIDYLSAIRLHG